MAKEIEQPEIVARADDKYSAHLNVIRDLLARLACPQTDKHQCRISMSFSHIMKRAPELGCSQHEVMLRAARGGPKNDARQRATNHDSHTEVEHL